MMMLRRFLAMVALALGVIPANLVLADMVAVYRVGDGSAALVNTGSPVFIDFYTTGGVYEGAIPLPSTDTGAANHLDLTASGVASSEGLITASPDGTKLAFTGYNAAVGGATSLAGTTSTAVNRTVGVLSTTNTNPTLYAFSDVASGNNPRSAVVAGNNLYVNGGASGVRYAPLTGAGSPTAGGTGNTTTQVVTVAPAPTNTRQLQVYGNQLFVSDSSTTGTNTVSVGPTTPALPTAAGASLVQLPGIPTITGTAANNPSPYSFYFANISGGNGFDTLYIADDGANASDPMTGLTKWNLDAGTWTRHGTIGTSTDAYRGLTAEVVAGNVTLFATRKGGSGATGGGELVMLTDASGFDGTLAGTPTVLATALANEAFRGVAVSQVVPEASALLLGTAVCCVVGLSYVARRKREVVEE
jgi:hypothetical protein